MENVEQKLREFIRENFFYGEERALSPETSFLESGIIDSTGMLELVVYLETTYGFEIQDVELVPQNLDSVSNVLRFVARKQVGSAAHAG